MEPRRSLPRPLDWAAALLVTAVFGALFLNASLLSAWDALHIDLSINLVASDALLDGDDPYGPTTLRERAESLGSPTQDVYGQLFTSYIQPPSSAMLLTPVSTLPWRDATHLGLIANHLLLAGAVVLMLLTMRPALPVRWQIAGAMAIVALYSQVYSSFVLGQWDAALVFLLALSLWALARRQDTLAGGAIALGAAVKLIPGLLLLYLLWRGRYRAVIAAAVGGGALLIVSIAYAGPDTWRTYLGDTLPALLKGSTHYSNASLQAIVARSQTPEVVEGLPELLYLSEVPSSTAARLASAALNLGAIAFVATILGWRRRSSVPSKERLFLEFYLVITAGLLVSSVTWEFYVVWLLPVFLAAFLAPSRLLPATPPPLRVLLLAAFALAFAGLNYPGDPYLFFPDYAVFDPGHALHQPDLIPGVWVEDRLGVYRNHLDVIVLLRSGSLLLLLALLSCLVLWHRRREELEDPSRSTEAAVAGG